MTLDAYIIRLHGVEAGWIYDIRPRWARYVVAARTVALFAADIPFGNRLFCNVVIDRMATVA